jgi:hypothetical protein
VNSKKLKKLKIELMQIRRSPQGRKSAELINFACQLGRVLDPRGKEPNYVRKIDPALSPVLSIPNHRGDVPVGTARSIIDALLSDIDEWEIHLLEEENDECD